MLETQNYVYAIVHGQAHFIVRKYCNKDFGLDLAERIVSAAGLKMKHSQTFTSASKKDITSYANKRDFDAAYEYGEAFSYVKCKTLDSDLWGETADFGESARFSFGKDFLISPKSYYELAESVEAELKKDAVVKLPRYRKVHEQHVLDYLNEEFSKHFVDYLNNAEVDDYWLTGVSFNFSNEYKCLLKINNHIMTELINSFDTSKIREAVLANEKYIKNNYFKIKVLFYNESDEYVYSSYLKDLMQVTITLEDKYYVLINSHWFEFNESYINYIKEKVDSISFEIKDTHIQTETELIEFLVSNENYTQLHKENVYSKGFCIEKADLMDDNNVIMVKAQNTMSDLVYLIKQASTSLRLSKAGELEENVFDGRNVCLWMLVDRKKLNKLPDFKSFHLLDALNDFRKDVINAGLTPVIWVSLKK